MHALALAFSLLLAAPVAMLQDSESQDAASRDTASQDTASQDTASWEAASQGSASQDTDPVPTPKPELSQNGQPIEIGTVAWRRDLEAGKAEAARTGKPILLLFQEVPG